MKDPWFVVKRYGVGLSPNGWKGWTCTAAFIVIAAAGTVWAHRTGGALRAIAAIALLLLAFVPVMLLTSDRKPWRWRWDKDDDALK